MESARKKISLFCLLLTSTFMTHAIAQQNKATMVSAPITQQNSKTYTKIQIGNMPTANVEVDTGSSMLVLEKKFVGNYTKTNKTIRISYGQGAEVITGQVVYANVTFNTNPKLTAKMVPTVMVPNGTFKGTNGILGLEMNNQVSAWVHLPSPYNRMVIINGPKKKLSFGTLSESDIKKFAYYKLKPKTRCDGHIKPSAKYSSYPCWQTRRVHVTYTFESPDGKPIYKRTYHTIFDSGGYATHFELRHIPHHLKQYTKHGLYKGTLKSAVMKTRNKGKISIPTTTMIKMTKSHSNKVNSGHQVFYEKAVLFDAQHGLIGVKE